MSEDRYVLRMVTNENRHDVQAYFMIFHGVWAVLPLVSAALILPIALWCTQIGMDLGSLIAVCSLPFVLSAVFVITVVNGKYPSYGIDLLKMWMFKVSERLYLHGWLDNPPSLWIRNKHV